MGISNHHNPLNVIIPDTSILLSDFGTVYIFNMFRLWRTSLAPGFKFPCSTACQARKASSYPTSIKASPAELKAGRLAPQNLEAAIRSLYHDGLVMVENAIPHEPLDALNKKMVEDAYALQIKGEDSPYNYNPGNLQQDAPPVREYFDKRIFLGMSRPDYANYIYLHIVNRNQKTQC